MTVFVNEFAGQEAQERQSVGAPLVGYSISSASTPVLLGSNTAFIRVTADGGSYVSWFSSATAANQTLGSSNAVRIAGNVAAERFQLVHGSTLMRITCTST